MVGPGLVLAEHVPGSTQDDRQLVIGSADRPLRGEVRLCRSVTCCSLVPASDSGTAFSAARADAIRCLASSALCS